MKQSSKRLASMLFALLFLAAAFLMFFDLIQPAYRDIQTKKGKQLSGENFLRDEERLVGQAKALVRQYDTESHAQENLALAMPSGPNMADAVAQVYGIAQNNGLTIRGITLSPPAIQLQSQGRPGGSEAGPSLSGGKIIKPMGTLSMQVTAVGSYGSFKNFISQLETNIRLFDLTGLSIQPVAGAVTAKGVPISSDLFTYNITVATYYQLP